MCFVGVFEPPSSFVAKEAECTLSGMQALVGGYVESLSAPLPEHFFLFDEDGRYKHLEPNVGASLVSKVYPHDCLLGDVVFVRYNSARDNWAGWDTEEDVYDAYRRLKECVSPS